MTRMAWLTALVGLSLAAAGLGADANAPDEGPTEEQMELLERKLEMEARQNEFGHEQQLRQLELRQREAETKRIEAELARMPGRDGAGGAAGVVLLWCLVANILLTVWVYKDMHQQGIARALWVPIVLLIGVFGAILYAIVRHADVQPKPAGRGAARRGG